MKPLYLTKNGIKHADWIKLCNRIFKLWVWYRQENDLRSEIDRIDASLNDTRPDRPMSGPTGFVGIQRVQLGIQLKRLQISRARPNSAELDLIHSYESRLWPVLKDAEEQVNDFNNPIK